MAKLLFVSFAKEDIRFRDLLVGQARNEKVPFEFVDMSVKQPWDTQWKTQCRTKIRRCDGVIALVSKNTASADGQLWEIACAREESIRVRGFYITGNRPENKPTALEGIAVFTWTWENIAAFVDSL